MFKILFIITVAIVSLIINFLFNNNGTVTFSWLDYEIQANISLFFFTTLLLLFLTYLFSKLVSAIHNNKDIRTIKSYKKHISCLTDGFIYLMAGDLEQSLKTQKQAKKYNKTSPLSELLLAQILYKEKNYKEALKLLKKIKSPYINEKLITAKLSLQNAVTNNDSKQIKESSKQILAINPKHKDSILALYKMHKQEQNWTKAEEILDQGIKLKAFSKKTDKKEISSIYANLAEDYFKKREYTNSLKYAKLAYNLDPQNITNTTLFSKLNIEQGYEGKALRVIRKIWTTHPTQELAKLYMQVYKNKKNKVRIAKQLYKLNRGHPESNLFIATMYFNNTNLLKARQCIKNTLSYDTQNKQAYKLLIEIEKTENPESMIIGTLEERLKKLK